MNRSLLLAAVMGCGGLTHAQAGESLSELDFLADMPIVLSVSRLPQRQDETPGAVTILDREMIRLSGARDVTELLRLVPGFQTTTAFETGAPVASYHGGFDSYSARLQVLVDGRSVYSPFLFGGVGPGLQSVVLDDIERIEVLRGSNSAAYGARAMLGVVNIVTRHTLDTLGGQARVRSGENGIHDALASVGWGGPDASFRVSADRRADDGLQGSNGHNAVSRVNLRADLRASSRDEVQLRAGSLAIDSGKGFAGKATDPLRDRFFGSGFVQLDWRRTLSENEDLALSLSHTEEAHRDQFLLSLLPYGVNDSILIDFGGQASHSSATLQHTFRYGSDLRVAWGGELRRETVTSKPLYNTDATLATHFTRLFGSAEWHLTPQWVLNAGAMAEHSDVTGTSVAPRTMLNWHVVPGHTLRAGISKAYRPPSTYEKYGNTRYNWNGTLLQVITASRGNVEPESLLTRELGYMGQWPAARLNLDVRVFEEQFGGFVRQVKYAVPAGTSLLTSNPLDYVNSEDFTIQGAEYQLTWDPWQDAKVMWGQSFTQVGSQDLGTSRAAPAMANTLMVSQRFPGGVDVSVMHQNSSGVTPQGAGFDNVRSIDRTDLRVGLPLRWGRQTGELAVVVQNLGLPYLDFDYRFRFERRAFVTLKIAY